MHRSVPRITVALLTFGALIASALPTEASARGGVLFGQGSFLSKELASSGKPFRSAIVSPDGRFIYAIEGNTVFRIGKDRKKEPLVNAEGYAGRKANQSKPQLNELAQPFALAFSPNGRLLYIVDTMNSRVLTLDIQRNKIAHFLGTPKGKKLTEDWSAGWLEPRATSLLRPSAITVGQSGTIYLCDEGNRRVIRVSADGKRVLKLITNPPEKTAPHIPRLISPRGIAVMPDEKHVYVSDADLDQVLRVETSGAGSLEVILGRGHAEGPRGGQQVTANPKELDLDTPLGLAVVPGTGSLLVADHGNGRLLLLKLDGSGVIDMTRLMRTAGGLITKPTDLSFAPDGSWLIGGTRQTGSVVLFTPHRDRAWELLYTLVDVAAKATNEDERREALRQLKAFAEGTTPGLGLPDQSAAQSFFWVRGRLMFEVAEATIKRSALAKSLAEQAQGHKARATAEGRPVIAARLALIACVLEQAPTAPEGARHALEAHQDLHTVLRWNGLLTLIDEAAHRARGLGAIRLAACLSKLAGVVELKTGGTLIDPTALQTDSIKLTASLTTRACAARELASQQAQRGMTELEAEFRKCVKWYEDAAISGSGTAAECKSMDERVASLTEVAKSGTNAPVPPTYSALALKIGQKELSEKLLVAAQHSVQPSLPAPQQSLLELNLEFFGKLCNWKAAESGDFELWKSFNQLGDRIEKIHAELAAANLLQSSKTSGYSNLVVVSMLDPCIKEFGQLNARVAGFKAALARKSRDGQAAAAGFENLEKRWQAIERLSPELLESLENEFGRLNRMIPVVESESVALPAGDIDIAGLEAALGDDRVGPHLAWLFGDRPEPVTTNKRGRDETETSTGAEPRYRPHAPENAREPEEKRATLEIAEAGSEDWDLNERSW